MAFTAHFPRVPLVLGLIVSMLAVKASAECGEGFQTLPEDVAKAKDDLISLANSNQHMWGDTDLQTEIEVLTTTLEDWYVWNRPTNEVELEKAAWRVVWVQRPFYVTDYPGFVTDRNHTYQVVRDADFGQVVKYDVGVSALFEFSLTVYTIENSKITELATNETCGQAKVNVWDLDFPIFYPFRFGIGWLSEDEMLTDIVDDVISGDIFTVGVPFVLGGGPDWVRFLDEDVRVVTHGTNNVVLVRDDTVGS